MRLAEAHQEVLALMEPYARNRQMTLEPGTRIGHYEIADAMGPNVAGVTGSVVAAGMLLALVGT